VIGGVAVADGEGLGQLGADRYATAQELADDLRRFLDDKPIRARRPTWAQRLWRWARRHPRVVLKAGLAALLLLVLGAVGLAANDCLARGTRPSPP
jgi:hypothetical protein